jgi:putative transposase
MSDALSNGRRFRTLNIIDDFNREALMIKAALSLPASYVMYLFTVPYPPLHRGGG